MPNHPVRQTRDMRRGAERNLGAALTNCMVADAVAGARQTMLQALHVHHFKGTAAMNISSTKPFAIRPYTVSMLVSDGNGSPKATISQSIGLGRALLRSSATGPSIVVAATGEAANSAQPEVDYRKLAKSVAAIAGETFTGKAVAQGAWKLSSLSSSTSPEDLTKSLIGYHVSAEKAKSLAEEALKLLHDPVTRGLLISVSAGAATFVVVQRTNLSVGRKWAIILGVATLAGLCFAALYKLGVAA